MVGYLVKRVTCLPMALKHIVERINMINCSELDPLQQEWFSTVYTSNTVDVFNIFLENLAENDVIKFIR